MSRVLIVFLLFFSPLFAKSDKYSNLPLPESIFITLEIDKCNNLCQLDNLSKGRYFSFLSNFDKSSSDDYLQRQYTLFSKVLNLQTETKNLKVALLMPRKMIGKYSITTTNSVLASLASSGEYFEFESFDSEDEQSSNINNTLKEIEKLNFEYLIAVVTKDGANNLASSNTKMQTYIPTVNKDDISNPTNNLFFGGINYKKQFLKLKPLMNEKVVIFYDDSELSSFLTSMQEELIGTKAYKVNITSSTVNFKNIIKKNINRFQNATIILNTPLVKSALVTSQLRYYEVNTHSILSSQINYNPLILTLTQYQDRKKLYIANSISDENSKLEAQNLLLGSDIVYDWIDYSTSIGIDNYISSKLAQNSSLKFDFFNNQIKYETKVLNTGINNFR